MIVGRVAAIVLIAHLLVLTISLVAPKQLVRSNPLTDLYSKLFIIGPFFPESRIKSSYHLYVSKQEGSNWMAGRDFADDAFRRYCAYPWRYDLLRAGDLEKNMAWRVASVPHDRSRRKDLRMNSLRKYVMDELLKLKTPDSVRLDYIRRTYVPERSSYRLDTLLTDTFYPPHLE